MRVMVAIPAYTGTIHLGTMRSLFTDLQELNVRGIEWRLHDECGNALIADARALIVAQFLDSGFDQLVFVDSDVCWQAGAMVKLIDHPGDMVAGIYPQRRDPIAYCVKWKGDDLWADENGTLAVDGVPFGFVKLRRDMLLKMVEQYPDSEFYVENAPGEKAWALFADYRIGRHKMGEDYAFCRRWTDMGGEVLIDPEISMGHVGYKTFHGHIGNWLKDRVNG